MKKVLLTTAPNEALIEPNGVGGNWYDRTDTYMAWTCAVDLLFEVADTACPLTDTPYISVPWQATFARPYNGKCVARSTRVEEDGFADGPFVGCAGGPSP